MHITIKNGDGKCNCFKCSSNSNSNSKKLSNSNSLHCNVICRKRLNHQFSFMLPLYFPYSGQCYVVMPIDYYLFIYLFRYTTFNCKLNFIQSLTNLLICLITHLCTFTFYLLRKCSYDIDITLPSCTFYMKICMIFTQCLIRRLLNLHFALLHYILCIRWG